MTELNEVYAGDVYIGMTGMPNAAAQFLKKTGYNVEMKNETVRIRNGDKDEMKKMLELFLDVVA